MTTLFADPAGPSIQTVVNAAASGDTVSCHPGVYNESIVNNANKDVKIIPTSTPYSAILDGQKTRGAAINYQAYGKLTLWDMEIRNYKAYGVQYNVPNTTGSGASYNPLGLMVPGRTYDVQRCIAHHIGSSDSSAPGFNAAAWPFWMNGGYQPIFKDNVAHHCGDTNESIGMVIYYAYMPTITGNKAYLCRKEGMRVGYGYRATIDSNRFYQNWSNLTHEYMIGSRASNNILHDGVFGSYSKQANSSKVLSNGGTIRQFWGDALGLGTGGSVPAPFEYVSICHNTIAGQRFNHMSVASTDNQDYVDYRNNLLVGLTYQRTDGSNLQPGDAFVQDAGSGVNGPHINFDYNTYVTAYGSPAFFLTKGQLTPGGSNSAATFAALQAWGGLGWEAHGQVLDPGFTNLADKNFAHPSAISGGYDLTTNPINPLGSPYGTQVGAIA